MSEPTEPKDPPKDDELDEAELEKVSGGVAPKQPSPGGPVPIPYPNIGITTK